jgi:enamine deaminase RidA (YjgF/YER057c/UK114 family)
MKAQLILNENAIRIPEPPLPAGNYESAIRHDSWLFLSGQFPMANGRLVYRGTLGREIDVETGYQAAHLCALNALAQMQKILISFDAVVGIARLEGYLQTAPGFHDHAKVLDGASDLFYQVLGDRGTHTRAVFGLASLPFDAPIEIVVTARTPPRQAWFWQRLIGSSRKKTLRAFDGRFVEVQSGVGTACRPRIIDPSKR